jgi:hypothetical protein
MKTIRLSDLANGTKPTQVILNPSGLDKETPTLISTKPSISSNYLVSGVKTGKSKKYLPIIEKTLIKNLNFKNFLNKFGNPTLTKISLFDVVGDIILEGDYSQNKIETPKFNLNIKTLDDVTFRFILSVKETISDSNPQLYTSSVFYNDLIKSYQENNPYMIMNAIKSEAIVAITYSEYLEQMEEFRTRELNVGKVGVVVQRNLFVDSNYNLINGAVPPALEANPSPNIDDLVRYINWVVSKPSAVYDERLLNPTEIGSWNLVTPTGIETAPPPPPPTPPPTAPPAPTPSRYQPVGREGFYQGEEVTASNGFSYIWVTTEGGRWAIQNAPSPGQGGRPMQ